MGRIWTPPSSQVSINWSTAVVSPLMMVCAGPLIAAMLIWVFHGCSSGRSSSGLSRTEAIVPVPASCASAALRRATTLAASARVNAPAMYAAAISPWECPITASGTIP